MQLCREMRQQKQVEALADDKLKEATMTGRRAQWLGTLERPCLHKVSASGLERQLIPLDVIRFSVVFHLFSSFFTLFHVFSCFFQWISGASS